MNISIWKEKGNKYLIFILLGLLILVICIPTGTAEEQDTSVSSKTDEGSLEAQLENVLSSMEGVGKVEVMITTESSETNLFGTDEGEKVCGVVVVAEGAGNAAVEARISDAVKALFSIDAHKISIVKMRSQEDDE